MKISVTNHQFTVQEEHISSRLDKFIALMLINLSRSKIKQIIESGKVSVNNNKIETSSLKLKLNDVVDVSVEVFEGTELASEKMDLEIVFEDEHLLVINKPRGISVHPGAGIHSSTLINGLVAHCGEEFKSVGSAGRPGIVHRLDKDTTGLMIVAKTSEAHHKLSEMIANREVNRYYLAMVFGALSQIAGRIETGYGRSKKDRTKWVALREGGKQAITNYKRLEIFGDNTLSLIECKLETGRTHQIRVHMANLRHPIVGDQSYGRGLNFNLNSLPIEATKLIRAMKHQALQAYKLEFIHPITGEDLKFELEIENQMKSILEALRA